ncbi:hypothetical protein DFH09DRAFT_270533 [Mycena vulgaris]|nr:hypothetical protein DFH09DRAFT_270533 [Mycena vulgaris]
MTETQPMFSVSESDFSDLRDNVVPDETLCLAIRDSIAAAELRLSTASSLPQGSYLEVSQECHDLRTFIAISTSRLAPIRRLPSKVLSKIFLDTTASDRAPRLGQSFPLPICTVSSHWRAIALSTATLWTHFVVSILGGDGALRTLELYLARSKDRGLSLSMTGERRHRYTEEVNPAIVAHLLRVSERWVSAEVRLPYRLIPEFASLRGRLPALESLLLHFESYSPIADLDIFEIAPRLHRLSVRALKPNSIPRLPRDQITELDFEHNGVPDLIRIASTFPTLRQLSFAGTPSTESVPRPDSLLTASTLILRGPLSTTTLHHLSAPALAHLDLHREQHGWQIPPFGDFLSRSGCTLRSLTLDDVLVRAPALLQLFPLIPSVETLTLRNLRPHALLDSALLALTLPPGAPPLLPALTTLTLAGSYLFSTPALLAMLESRATLSRLHRVDLLIGHRQFSAEDVRRLRALQGVKVTLNLVSRNKTAAFVKVI